MKDWQVLVGFLGLLWVVAIVLLLSFAVIAPIVSTPIICAQAAGPNHSGKITCK